MDRETIREKITAGITQKFIFSEFECLHIEGHVNELVNANDEHQKQGFDSTSLRKKYFFGEGYTYGLQMHRKGPGMERLYPKGHVDPIPSWIINYIINPLVLANLIPQDFINCVVINDYQPHGCIVSHIDPLHIFDRPIISLSLFSDSALSFGCKFEFQPLRCSPPLFRLPLPRGIVTLISGFAANDVTHCVRPEDIKSRRAVIMLRRVLPTAPRLSSDKFFMNNSKKKKKLYNSKISASNSSENL